jgi:hypothetical protein
MKKDSPALGSLLDLDRMVTLMMSQLLLVKTLALLEVQLLLCLAIQQCSEVKNVS